MNSCKVKCQNERISINWKICNVEYFSVKNLPRNLLKEARPPSQIKSGPRYFSCTQLPHENVFNMHEFCDYTKLLRITTNWDPLT